jgi:hypothetical protein
VEGSPQGLRLGTLMADARRVCRKALHIAHADALRPGRCPDANIQARPVYVQPAFHRDEIFRLFGIVRRETEKDMVLLVKSARSEFVVSRISRIAANDMHVEVRKGAPRQKSRSRSWKSKSS